MVGGAGGVVRLAVAADQPGHTDDTMIHASHPHDHTPPLALRPREAARMLGVSARLLWSLTAPRGPIPCTRIGGRGGCVLYRPADLDAWLRAAATRPAPPAEGGGE